MESILIAAAVAGVVLVLAAVATLWLLLLADVFDSILIPVGIYAVLAAVFGSVWVLAHF